MTDFDVILEKLQMIDHTQKAQGDDIKILAKAFTELAVQNEQITNLQNQTNVLWRKYDEIVGPQSILEKVRDHQKGCPKDSLPEQFKAQREEYKTITDRLWVVFGIHSLILTTLCGWIVHFMVTR